MMFPHIRVYYSKLLLEAHLLYRFIYRLVLLLPTVIRTRIRMRLVIDLIATHLLQVHLHLYSQPIMYLLRKNSNQELISSRMAYQLINMYLNFCKLSDQKMKFN